MLFFPLSFHLSHPLSPFLRLHLYLSHPLPGSLCLLTLFTSLPFIFLSLYSPRSLPILFHRFTRFHPPLPLHLITPPFSVSVINFPIPGVLSLCLPVCLPLWPLLSLPLPFASLIFTFPPFPFLILILSLLLAVVSLINYVIFSSLRCSSSLSLSVLASPSAAGSPCSGLSVISLIYHRHQSETCRTTALHEPDFHFLCLVTSRPLCELCSAELVNKGETGIVWIVQISEKGSCHITKFNAFFYLISSPALVLGVSAPHSACQSSCGRHGGV